MVYSRERNVNLEVAIVTTLKTAVVHLRGTRTQQEDDYAVLRAGVVDGRSGDTVIAIVADGMGGHEGGRLASVEAVAAVRHYVLGSDEPLSLRLPNSIIAANTRVRALKTRSGLHDAGCAIVVVACSPHGLVVAHLGDCRAYLFANGKVVQLTRDHTLDVEAGKASTGNSPLTRAVGIERTAQPELFQIRLNCAYRLLACSDGIVKPNEMEALIAVAAARSITLASTNIERLVCIRRRSDNATAVVIESGDFHWSNSRAPISVERPPATKEGRRTLAPLGSGAFWTVLVGAAVTTAYIGLLLAGRASETVNMGDVFLKLESGDTALIRKKHEGEKLPLKRHMRLRDGEYVISINCPRPTQHQHPLTLEVRIENGVLQLLKQTPEPEQTPEPGHGNSRPEETRPKREPRPQMPRPPQNQQPLPRAPADSV